MTDDLVERATTAINRYIAMRTAQPLKGLDDTIHAIHTGTEYEAELTFSDIVTMSAKIERLTERCEAYKGQVKAGQDEIERIKAERNRLYEAGTNSEVDAIHQRERAEAAESKLEAARKALEAAKDAFKIMKFNRDDWPAIARAKDAVTAYFAQQGEP